MERTTRTSPAHPQFTVLRRPRRRRSPWRALGPLAGAAALVALTSLAAYGSHDPALARRNISGTYAVSSAAGLGLPATVVDTGLASPSGGDTAHLTIVVTRGDVTLTPSGTYSARLAYTVRLDGDEQVVEGPGRTGTYVVAGSAVTFRSAAGEVVATGTLSDGALAVSGDLLGADAIRRWCALSQCTARPGRGG